MIDVYKHDFNLTYIPTIIKINWKRFTSEVIQLIS